MEFLRLQRENLELELDCRFPLIYRIFHAGRVWDQFSPFGSLIINEIPIAWTAFKIEVNSQLPHTVEYICSMLGTPAPVTFSIRFSVQGTTPQLSYQLQVKLFEDPEHYLHTLGWFDLPVFIVGHPSYQFWRDTWIQNPWNAPQARGIYRHRTNHLGLGKTSVDLAPMISLYACVYDNAGHTCGVYSSERLAPFLTQVRVNAYNPSCHLFSVTPSPFRFWNGTVPRELTVTVGFLTDLNGDGISNANEYYLWLNRQLPVIPDPIYLSHIYYKIFCAGLNEIPTTLAQTREIIIKVANLTDNLPQIVYLVGWQEGGHDGNFPALNRLHPNLGDSAQFNQLVAELAPRNVILSYHLNLDDAYPSSTEWDPSIITTAPSGEILPWEVFWGVQSYHQSHSLATVRGVHQRRLEQFMKLLPVTHTLHFDAHRNTNCSWRADGFTDEFSEWYNGILPLHQWLQQTHKISVTIESDDFAPLELCGIIGGILHGRPYPYTMIYHRKMVSGGFGSDAMDWFRGNPRHHDIVYDTNRPEYSGFLKTANEMNRFKDELFLGGLLIRFFRRFEFRNVVEQDAEGNFRADYEDGVEVILGDEWRITQREVTIACEEDRFVPLGDAIYVYSQNGGEKWWILPLEFRNSPLTLWTLTLEGRTAPPAYVLEPNRIQITLLPRTPVKIVKSG